MSRLILPEGGKPAWAPKDSVSVSATIEAKAGLQFFQSSCHYAAGCSVFSYFGHTVWAEKGPEGTLRGYD